MLNDATGFDKIFIATGYTDLRRGIDGLASTIKYQFDLDPFQKNILFLFCGKRTDRIKGLVWEGDGFLLLYKRLNVGGFSWPRTKEEALEVTPEQYHRLMQGLEIVAKRPIAELGMHHHLKALAGFGLFGRHPASFVCARSGRCIGRDLVFDRFGRLTDSTLHLRGSKGRIFF